MWGLSSNGILESYQYRVFGPFLLARKKLKSRPYFQHRASLAGAHHETSLLSALWIQRPALVREGLTLHLVRWFTLTTAACIFQLRQYKRDS